MISWIKISSILSLIVAAFIGGWYVHRPAECPPSQISEHTSNVEKHVDNVTKTVTIVKKPDGTTIETTKNEEKTSKEISKSDDHVKVSREPAPPKSKYSLGIEYLPSFAIPDKKDVEIQAGARLGDSDFWLKGGYDFRNKQIKVGIEYQF